MVKLKAINIKFFDQLLDAVSVSILIQNMEVCHKADASLDL